MLRGPRGQEEAIVITLTHAILHLTDWIYQTSPAKFLQWYTSYPLGNLYFLKIIIVSAPLDSLSLRFLSVTCESHEGTKTMGLTERCLGQEFATLFNPPTCQNFSE